MPPYTVETNSCFRWSHICFRYEGETGGERNLVSFEDKPINDHINENVSSRARL